MLSACQTALGGRLGNGEEILGFGYQVQRTGARAAIASLWTVDDGGIQALMNAFYTALQNGTPTKAAALQQAQLALLHGETAQFSPVVDHVSTSIDTYTYPYYCILTIGHLSFRDDPPKPPTLR